MVNVEVQKRLVVELMARLAIYVTSLIRDQIKDKVISVDVHNRLWYPYPTQALECSRA